MTWTDTKVDSDDDILAADWNAMVTDQKTRGVTTEDKRGSNCSLNDGDTSRVLTLANTSTTKSDGFLVVVNGTVLHSADYTATHNSSSSTVTFNNPVHDSDYIKVIYFT